MNITKRKSSIAWKVLALICCMAGALSAATFGNFTYTDDGTSITITDYSESAVGEVVIPAAINGKPVTTIGNSAFYWCTNLTSITIPAGVTTIGDSAFYWCTSLTSITIPAGVTTIGDSAFYNCSGLTSVTIPSSVTTIGGRTFVYCTGLTSISIPASVTSIGDSAFYGCSKLTSITIPAGVTSIGAFAFTGCTGLTSITIPASVTSIGDSAFSACSSLTAISVDALNSSYSSANGILFDKSQATLIQCPGGKTGSITIPAGVTTIGGSAFYGCYQLTGITIPAGVTTIGDSAFYDCDGLTNITIPVGVTTIGYSAFRACSSLTSVTIPSSVTSIGDWAFFYCTSLTSVTIPASVTSIGDGAFSSCTGLTSAYFQGDAPTMGTGAFSYAASGFKVYYFNGKTGFTSPTWNGYPSVNMGDSTPAASWLLSNNLPYNANLQTDPDGDGVSLLMAYALNLNPGRNLSNSMPKPVLAADQLSMTFYAGTAGVSYAVETSTDLQNWSAAGVTLSAPDGNNRRTATVPATGPQRYMRLVASY